MKRAVVVRPRAQIDIDECAAFIALDNPDAARRFLASAERSIKATLLFPRRGSPRPSARKALSGLHATTVMGFRNYLIFYRVLKSGGVRVLRVLHGARDVTTILRLAK